MMFSSIDTAFARLRQGRRTLQGLALRILAPDTLDMDVLSDHLKRDIGLMDGRDPRPRPERYR